MEICNDKVFQFLEQQIKPIQQKKTVGKSVERGDKICIEDYLWLR